ncbi:MAG: MFS transporter, partial [Chlamydiota bacterium]
MRFLPLLMTVFIDSLGFGLVYPIFSSLILTPEQSILPTETSVAIRGLLFGMLVSAFCVGQFFGGPILGALSDRLGRKKILIASLWLAVIAYLLAGLGIVIHSIALLFVGRLLSGWGASNWSIAQSIIVDQSSVEEKSKNFGLLGMAWGTGFVIGPFMGGKLSDPAINGGIGLS